ncbi:MAG: hypothetical protein A2075_19370 [Geobacteraceae bacterium GWC2_58_44]|nr:MAG: hypothetical protein A2075_19370 [Geobacteraceae bacterium GWC2_58_44]HBG06810.1 hypothetical protein [Geobacter sp.]
MSTLFSMSIRAQLFLMVLIVAFPAVGIIVYAGIQAREGAIAEAVRDAQRLGDGIADAQRNMHTSAEQLMSALAKLPEVKRRDAAEVRSILGELVRQNPRYTNISIADRSGTVWATGVGSTPFSIADRRHFQHAVATGKLSSGEYVVGRGSSKPTFHFSYPVKDRHAAVVDVLALGFDLECFREQFEHAYLPPGSSYLLVDRDGVILGRGVDPERYVGKKDRPDLFALMQGGAGRGVNIGVGLDGRKWIVSYQKLRLDHESRPYMYIRSGMPFDVVVAEADRVLLQNLALFASCLFCACLLAWLIGKRSIIDRVSVLLAASRRLAGGDLRIRTSELVRGGELGALGAAFDDMARQMALREQEQLTAELALKKSEFHYRSIFENSLFGVGVVGADLRFIQVNDAFCRMLGYSERELVGGMGLAEVTHPDDAATSIEMVRKIFSLELEHYVLEKRYLSRDGNYKEVMLFVQGIYDEHGNCTGATGSVLDVTERKQVVEVLKENEDILRTLMEAMPVGVGFYDNDSRIEHLNSRFVEWFGYAKEDVPTLDDWYRKAYPDPECREEYIARLEAAIAQAKQSGTPMGPVDARITCKDGSVRHVIISYQFSQRRTLSIFTDITERELQQSELLKAQKLESLGVLAGGIAHDFNNVLTGIMGNISIAQMYLEPPHKACLPLEQAEKASKRAAELAYQLMTFAKGGKPIKAAVSVSHLLQEAVSLVLRGANVKAQLSIPESIHAIEADEGQISQTFHNIIINAVQAMPQGGTLKVRAENLTLCARSVLPLPAGQYVKISFKDQGGGIPPEAQAKIFDPYFTTKPDGTGLGLASVHSIVSKHGGHVEVSSVLGQGTVFDFYLPSTGQAWSGAKGDLPPLCSGGEAGGTILIMDDEEMIRSLVTEMLSNFGYQVVASSHGAEAVEQYRAAREAGTPFDAVILDLTIPGGMGGREAAQQILTLDPAARVIVSSGYCNDPVMADYRSYGLSGAVMKPYRVAELAQGLAFLREPPAASVAPSQPPPDEGSGA